MSKAIKAHKNLHTNQQNEHNPANQNATLDYLHIGVYGKVKRLEWFTGLADSWNYLSTEMMNFQEKQNTNKVVLRQHVVSDIDIV